MKIIMREMNELKEKANTEKLKLQQEEKMVQLVKERDWFREEALKINKIQKNQKLILERLKLQYEGVQEDRDYYQAQLFEDKQNLKSLSLENLKLKQGKLKLAKFNASNSKMGSEDAAAITYSPDFKQSAESIKRMKDQSKLFAESEAVKEYKFITEQIKTLDDPANVNLTGIDFSPLD